MPGRPRKAGYPWGNPVQVSGICPNRTQNSTRGMAKVPNGGDRRRPFGGSKFRIIRTDPSETKGIIRRMRKRKSRKICNVPYSSACCYD